MKKIKEFEADLALFWHCEGRDNKAVGQLRRAFSYENHLITSEEFKIILDEVILTRRYSVDEYEALTGIDFTSVDEVVDDLKMLRDELYSTS